MCCCDDSGCFTSWSLDIKALLFLDLIMKFLLYIICISHKRNRLKASEKPSSLTGVLRCLEAEAFCLVCLLKREGFTILSKQISIILTDIAVVIWIHMTCYKFTSPCLWCSDNSIISHVSCWWDRYAVVQQSAFIAMQTLWPSTHTRQKCVFNHVMASGEVPVVCGETSSK